MTNDLFEKAPIRTAYLKLAIPVVLSMVVTLVYNMVDTYFIALTKNTNLIAGVSICTPLFTLFLATWIDMPSLMSGHTDLLSMAITSFLLEKFFLES